LIGGTLYMVPVLLRTRLWGERAAHLALYFWNLALVVGTVTLLAGYSQGREWADWIFRPRCRC